MRFVDSHCHLEEKDFGPDREPVIERARAAGVDRLICIGSGAGLDEIRNAVALAGSHEAALHNSGNQRFWLDTEQSAVRDHLAIRRLERAIGVIYRPQTERGSHYFDASLAAQFDAVIHLDHTRAVEPLERTSLWDRGEPPETFPSGF